MLTLSNKSRLDPSKTKPKGSGAEAIDLQANLSTQVWESSTFFLLLFLVFVLSLKNGAGIKMKAQQRFSCTWI